jgi:hypothetical protein
VGTKIHIVTTWEVDNWKNITEIYFKSKSWDEEIQIAQNRVL